MSLLFGIIFFCIYHLIKIGIFILDVIIDRPAGEEVGVNI